MGPYLYNLMILHEEQRMLQVKILSRDITHVCLFLEHFLLYQM